MDHATQYPQPKETEFHREAAQMMRDNPKLSRHEAMQRVLRKHGEPARQAFIMGHLKESDFR